MDKLEKVVVFLMVVAAAFGFLSTLADYGSYPDRETVDILLPGDIAPLYANKVQDVSETDVVGSIRPIFDTYVFESIGSKNVNISAKDDRKNSSILITVRGADQARNLTYEFKGSVNVLIYNDKLRYFYQNTEYEFTSFAKGGKGWILGVTFLKSAGFDALLYGLFLAAVYAIIILLLGALLEYSGKKISAKLARLKK